jgi:hypothetical protein
MSVSSLGGGQPVIDDAECHAAVDDDFLPGDVVGSRRGEKQGKRLDVIGLADTTHRDHAREGRLHPDVQRAAAADAGREDPRRDRVGRDPVGGQFQRDRVHEVPRAGLGRQVSRADHGLDHRGRDRRGDDDSPGPSRAHVAGGGARRGEDPVEVDLDDPVPALVAVALERAVGRPCRPAAAREADEAWAGIDPGVGKRDIEPAVHRRRFVDHAIQRGPVSHVRDRSPHVEPFAAEPRGLRRDRVAIDVDQRDPRAVSGKGLSAGEPQAAGPAGDDHAVPGHARCRGKVHGHADSLTAGEATARPVSRWRVRKPA